MKYWVRVKDDDDDGVYNPWSQEMDEKMCEEEKMSKKVFC